MVYLNFCNSIPNILLFCFLVASTFSCKDDAVESEATPINQSAEKLTITEQQRTAGGIQTATPAIQMMSEKLHLNGVVDVPPQNIISVSFPLGGYLRSTKLLPGMHVSRSEVIAVMEDQSLIQLQQDYLVAQARLKYLELDLQRQQTLRQNEVNAEKTLQQVQADHQSQKVLVRGFSEKLRLIGINPDRLTDQNISRSVSIYSPINGFVSKVNVNIGKFVNPADVLFELINPNDMHAALNVFEKDINKVKKGQRVNVSFVDDPETKYPCEVILVTRNVGPDRSGIIHCHFEKMPKNLLPGMFINADVLVSNNRSATLPEEAIVQSGNKEYIFEEIAKNTFKMVEVETGASSDGVIAISHNSRDLSSSNFVVKNAYLLLSMLKNTADE